MKKLPLILLALLLLTAGCSSIDCPVQNRVATVYVLKKANGTADTLKGHFAVMTRRATGKDTTLYGDTAQAKSQVELVTLQLPIGYTTQEDTLFFVLRDTSKVWADTVFVKKENRPQFESVDCKMSFFHTLTGVRLSSHNLIDSISIVKTAVTYDLSEPHFNIYFKSNR